MIDWLTVVVPLPHPAPIAGGAVLILAPDGSVERASPRAAVVEGSHDARLMVRTECYYNGQGEKLWISGNPVKWFQGHNLFGASNITDIVYSTIIKICGKLGIEVSAKDADLIARGCFEVKRVDINESYCTGSRGNCLAWLREAGRRSYLTHRGAGVMRGSTVYWGKNSRRWSLKAYAKGQELEAGKKHQLPENILLRERLVEWADDKLRLELTLRSKELLRLGLSTGAGWMLTMEQPEAALRERMKGLHMADELRVTDEALSALPSGCRTAFEAWKAGVDVRQTLSRATFYRYRKELLPLGVDLAIHQGADRSNVVPLMRYIVATGPAEVPSWAKGTPIYFEPLRCAQ